MNNLLSKKNYSSSLVDEHLLYLNNLYKLDIKLNYGDSNFYRFKTKTITLNPECPDILFSLYHEYYHARKQYEPNSIQLQFQLANKDNNRLDDIKFSVLMIFLLTCLGQYFIPELQEVAVLFFLICLRLCWYNPNTDKINHFQPQLHFNEYRADAFALKHLKRLPKADWLVDLDQSFTHPSTKSRLTLLQRLIISGDINA